MAQVYSSIEPSRAEIERLQGPVVLEFGANWCGICQAAQPAIAQAMNAHPDVQHIKVGDGKGQPLGRSFRVKLWPTLIGLRDGREVARVVRPTSPREIAELLSSLKQGG